MEAVDDVKQHIHYSAPEKPLYPSDNYNGVNHANTHLSPFRPTALKPQPHTTCSFTSAWELGPENESIDVTGRVQA